MPTQSKMSKNEESMAYLLKLYYTYINDPAKVPTNIPLNVQRMVVADVHPELEIRFNQINNHKHTQHANTIKKTHYNNVVQRVLSLGFVPDNAEGTYLLRANNEFTDNDGNKRISNVRVELEGLDAIHLYNKFNDISDEKLLHKIKFLQKEKPFIDKKPVYPVNIDDFGFRMSLQVETGLKKEGDNIEKLIKEWKNYKKNFRFLNRVRFIHPEIPIFVDVSIVKSSRREEVIIKNTKKFIPIPTFNIGDSGIFTDIETYEIELEIDNRRVGIYTKNYNTEDKIMTALRKMIRHILAAFQQTNYPISFREMHAIHDSYLRLLHGQTMAPRSIELQDFIGPASRTLQIEHLITANSPDVAAATMNVKQDMTVTDKADGERRLLYFHRSKRIYMIDTNMNVIFTGYELVGSTSFIDTLLDGEFIKFNKNGQVINLFACFDNYFMGGNNKRSLPFISAEPQEVSRLTLLNELIRTIRYVPVVRDGTYQGCEFKIEVKRFEIIHGQNNFFQACSKILNAIHEYNTDGLIFTPSYFGVGTNRRNTQGQLQKITWDYSLKWKPPQYNTVDFLVSMKKNGAGGDLIQNSVDGTMIHTYKTIHLLCGYDSKRHKSSNVFAEMIQALTKKGVAELVEDETDSQMQNSYVPVPFQPTDPFDAEAYICNIALTGGGEKGLMRTEEGEFFEEHTIVEFRYDPTRPRYWRWIPLRVRLDKTMELKNGSRNYGNAYHVANNIWKSIHNPITEEMLKDPTFLPESVALAMNNTYYKTDHVSKMTVNMRNFHNLFVKSKLIKSVAKPDDILIDYACGKGGDLHKWIDGKLKFVLGLDIFRDNILNSKDGACHRYLDATKNLARGKPKCLFLEADSRKNIRSSGEAFEVGGEMSSIYKEIAFTVFGNFTEEAKQKQKLGVFEDSVMAMKGLGTDGFHVSSIQFALHYFFENKRSLLELCRNIQECTRMQGYFIGTCYDGEKVFRMLSQYTAGQEHNIVMGTENIPILKIKKQYDATEFTADEMSLGLAIDVYQDSIGQYFREYLVNFDYFIQMMTEFGFTLLNEAECKQLGIARSIGSFKDLYDDMVQGSRNRENERGNGKRNPFAGCVMTEAEKQISFLNNYFIFKKKSNVTYLEQKVMAMLNLTPAK
jgi:hypothetical protein